MPRSYRCLRCDSWVALRLPERPRVLHPPSREETSLPLRGRPLRDRYVLRLIAIDRVDLQGGLGGPVNNSNHGIVHDLHNLFAISIANLYVAGAAIAC